MVYKTFLDTVKSSLSSRLGSDYSISIQPVRKNNGLVLDGLCIVRTGESASPTIYLDPFYEDYENGRSMERILEDILKIFQNSLLPDHFSIKALSSREQILDSIIFRLINYTANQALLKEIPYISFPDLDLSLVFCLLFTPSNGSIFSSIIHNSHQDHWKLSVEELYQAAKANTPRLLPARIRAMTDVIKSMTKEAMAEEFDENALDSFIPPDNESLPLYVLNNSTGSYGASCLFYDGILKDFADRMDSDLVILPSSVHEVLLTPYSKNISYEDLAFTVRSINTSEVPVQYQLSNHIYYYSKDQESITTVFTSSCPIGTENPL